MAKNPYSETESGSNRDQRKIVRIPLVGNALNRDSAATKDQKFVNCYPETSKNTVANTQKLFLVKRPGFVEHATIAAAGTSRGFWSFFGHTFSVIGDKLYEDTILIKTLRSSTGICGMVQISPISCFFCDGTDGYEVKSNGAVTEVERAYPKWTADEYVEVGDKRIPTAYDMTTPTASFFYYTVQSISTIGTGLTGSIEPSWPLTVGQTVVDNQVTWVCTATRTVSEIARKWAASYAFTVGQYVLPTAENAIYYKVTASDGAAGVTEPTWPLAIGESVTLDGVTYEAVGYYGGFPSPHITTPVFMDGYTCLAESGSVDFYNSGINDVFSWSPIDFTSAENYPDPLVALARQNNFIVAFGEDNTELFYDAANASGSPFSRNENYLLQVGLYSPNAIFQAEKYLVWVGKSDTGRPSVWSLNGYEAKEISTEYIERMLLQENIGSNITGYGIRTDGHIFFVINLPVNNKTIVYDMEEEMWHEWSYNSGMLPFKFFAAQGTNMLFQHNTDGKLYRQSRTVYKDGTYDMPVSIVMLKQDFDNYRRKFFHRIDVVGDQINTNVSVSWSDDDYQNYSTPVTISMLTRPYFTRCGTSRRRAWKITHTDNTPLRLEALEVTYTQGRT